LPRYRTLFPVAPHPRERRSEKSPAQRRKRGPVRQYTVATRLGVWGITHKGLVLTRTSSSEDRR
jgi:hypothetical protein